MQYIITFMLVIGTTFQIVQSVEDQLQINTDAWTIQNPIIWFKNFANTRTNEIINFTNNVKEKLKNFPFISCMQNTEMVDGNVERVNIYTSKTIITPSQDSVTDIQQDIIVPQVSVTDMKQDIIVPQDSVTDMKKDIIVPQDSVTDMKQDIIVPQDSVTGVETVMIQPLTNIIP